MALTIIQPDESQTFLFKYGPYGEEHQFNAKEILQKMRDYYQQNFDSVVLLPYAYEAFGYFIAGCQIGSGSDDSMYLANEDYVTNSGSDHCIAIRPLYSNVMPMCAFNTDGTLSYSFGTVSMSTLYYGPPDGNTIWNIFNGNYSIPYVLYTECSCNHLYINGEEYKFGDATCKVTYFLPDDDYQYTKLTYKRDVQPESVNDGTIVNLDPTKDFVTVEGLVENANYWFKIFTSKSESEAFPYTIPIDPVPPEYKPYINEINRKVFGKTGDESFILDRSIGGTIFGVNHGYGDSFVNLSGFRIESSSNTFAVYVIPYVRIDIDFDETNNRYVATSTNLIGAVGLTEPEKNYFECVANLQKPFEIRSSFKVSYNINNSLSPVVAISDSVIGCLQQLQGLCCYVDIYVDGIAIDIVSR